MAFEEYNDAELLEAVKKNPELARKLSEEQLNKVRGGLDYSAGQPDFGSLLEEEDDESGEQVVGRRGKGGVVKGTY